MKIENTNSDSVVLKELGGRLARRRLEDDLTQDQLAQEAGVSRATIERLEGGRAVKSTSLIRVLRSLDRLEALDRLIPEPLPSPIERIRMGGRERRRAAGSRRTQRPQDAATWKWGDEGE
jgi:transcriptional regulator with XRE-family HTH domain